MGCSTGAARIAQRSGSGAEQRRPMPAGNACRIALRLSFRGTQHRTGRCGVTAGAANARSTTRLSAIRRLFPISQRLRGDKSRAGCGGESLGYRSNSAVLPGANLARADLNQAAPAHSVARSGTRRMGFRSSHRCPPAGRDQARRAFQRSGRSRGPGGRLEEDPGHESPRRRGGFAVLAVVSNARALRRVIHPMRGVADPDRRRVLESHPGARATAPLLTCRSTKPYRALYRCVQSGSPAGTRRGLRLREAVRSSRSPGAPPLCRPVPRRGTSASLEARGAPQALPAAPPAVQASSRTAPRSQSPVQRLAVRAVANRSGSPG